MNSTRWFILLGLIIWPLSCALVYFFASDTGYSRALASAQARVEASEQAGQETAAPGSSRASARRPSGHRVTSSRHTFAADSFVERTDRIGRGRSPMQRLAAATTLRNPQHQHVEMRVVTADFTLNDVLDSLSQIQRMDAGPARERMLRSVIGRWAQLEPEAALAFALDEQSPNRRRHYIEDAFRGWASVDPSAALAYLEDPNTEEFDRSTYRAIFEGLGQGDPTSALAHVTDLDVNRYGRGLSMAVRNLFTADPDEVIAWAGGLPDGALRRMVTPMIVDQWGRYDPEAALAWVESGGADQDRRTLEELGESWARVDPRGAMDWYEELPPDQQDPRILNGIFDRWLRYEPDTAAAWIVEQPATEDLDHALERYVRSVSRESPDIALEWAMAIVNDRRRTSAINQVISPWLRSQPEIAIEYLKTSTLPDDVAQGLLERAEEALRARQQ